ncbi:MAG: hypothetical protein IPK26_06785 [Planctomycetes bacterium]|nr:hypothetical protein [Planctomycetota bacterium]
MNTDDWQDQLADRALHELHGETPPDLTVRVLAALHAGSATPAAVVALPARVRSSARRFLAAVAVAAGLLIALAVLAWPSPPRGQTAIAHVELAVLEGGIAVTEVEADDRPGRAFTLTTGADVAWAARPGDLLASTDGRGAAVLLRPFGVVTTEAHTRLEVRAMEMSVKNGVLATGSLTLAVVAGVATWHTLSRVDSAEAGQVLRMEAQADGGSAAAALVTENQKLKDELAAAQQRAEALATQLARQQAEVPAKPPASADEAAPAPAEAAPVPATVTFGDAQFGDALAGVDWQLVGSVSAQMNPMLAELLAKMDHEGAELPMELVVEVQKLNMKLVEQLPGLLKAGLPGFGPNGTYLHPLVASNSLASMLAHAGQGLNDAQRNALAGLVRIYSAEAQGLQGQSHDFELEGLAADVAMKDRFFAETQGLLGPEQAALMTPPGSLRHDGGNLFDTGLMFQLHNDPIPASNPAEFARATSQKLEQQLGLEPAQAEQVRALLERHAGAASELWRDRGTPAESNLRMLKSGRGKAALQRQLQWMRELQQQVSLTKEQAAKLKGLKRVFVPLPR